ncbi:unnamed protein product [Adineta ricciae]|uniref:Spermatogenesis-associated protein 1 C-terminal domain-containing protein n=1 Tax=Adineta ricciae TaxID=249248 RepID=A0A814ETI2_ADIRI|nr:unnamed protein product [Adineta ricciae]
MEPQMESEPSSLRNNLITVDRPDTAQLVDLHVYVIPTSVWQEQKNLAENDAIEQAISAGFVHVPQNLTIYDLRQHITDICGQEDGFPKDFIYLRSVGRCLAKVRPQQELELKVKNYRPPITFAPEIYVLEGHHDDDSSLATTTGRQESWTRSFGESPAPVATLNPSFINSSSEQQNSTILDRSATSSTSTLSRASSTLSARDLAKLREEQERLRLRQIELARQRREIEEEQQRRKTTESSQSDDSKPETRRVELSTRDIEAEKLKAAKEQEEQQRRRRELEVEAQKIALQREEQKQREKQEEEAATRIQASFRGYQSRQKSKDKKRHDHAYDADNDKQRLTSNFAKSRGVWSADSDRERNQSPIKHKTIHSLPLERNEAQELERLQREARELARRKAEEDHAEEIKAHEVVRLSEQLEKLKSERIELENNREAIIRRMQQLHAQIVVRRTEERDLWKQKYLVQKKKTAELEEKTRAASQNQPDLASRTEQTKLRLNHSTKLRQQAENECQLLKQELHQMRSSLHNLEKPSIPTKLLPPPPPLPQQQQQQNIPITFDITLKY